MSKTTTRIRPSYIQLRGVNLGAAFIKDAGLTPGQKYSMTIEGVDDTELEGTLDKSGFIGGLAKLYREFDLVDGDAIEAHYDGGVIQLVPPAIIED